MTASLLTPTSSPTPSPAPAAGSPVLSTPTGDGSVIDAGIRVTPARVVRAEWLKFRTVRSNLVGLVSAGAVTVGLGLLFSSLAGGDDAGPPNFATDPVAISLGGVNLAQIVVAVLGVVFVTTEYGSGLIRTMFGAVPRRLSVLAAKAGVVAAATTAVMTVAVVIAFLAGQAVYGVPGAALSLGDDGVIRALLGTGLYLGGVGAMGVALGFLLRSAGSAIGVVVGTLLVAPVLVNLLPADYSDPLNKILPSSAGSAFRAVSESSSLLSPAAGAVVFALWVAGLLTTAALVVRRRDA